MPFKYGMICTCHRQLDKHGFFLFVLKDAKSSCQDISNLILPAKILENSPNFLQSANIMNIFSSCKYFTGPLPVISASVSLCLCIHLTNPQIKPFPSLQDWAHFHSNKTSAISQITFFSHDTYTIFVPISKQERSAMALLMVLRCSSFIQQPCCSTVAVYLQQVLGLNNFTRKQFWIEMP